MRASGTQTTCVVKIDHGVRVTLTATAADHYDLTGFTGDCRGDSCTFTIYSPKVVRAGFELLPLAAEAGGPYTATYVSVPLPPSLAVELLHGGRDSDGDGKSAAL